MATSVAAIPQEQMSAVDPAEARKRRREILASQRDAAACPESPTSVMDSTVSTKKRKLDVAPAVPVLSSGTVAFAQPSVISSKTGKPKKPQMKYDPEVPMTKEEAAAWRREQRRKRNRESAAASRQRQRDRIAELEEEVEGWKVKFEQAMKKIKQIEEAAAANGGTAVSAPPEATSSAAPQPAVEAKALSPAPAKKEVLQVTVVSPESLSSRPSCVSPHDEGEAPKVMSRDGATHVQGEEVVVESQPIKMISRPAVKITGSTTTTTTLPFLPDESALLPDACASTSIKLEPIDSTLFPTPAVVKEEVMPTLLTSDEEGGHDDPEFGEFLLDAVDWL